MATIGNSYVTLSDLKGRLDPDGSLADVVEQATDQNHVMQDMLLLEGNETSGNRATVRTGLPAGTWRELYGGVPNERSTTKQVTDTVGILESYSRVDQHLVEMAPDPARFRANEDAAFLEGMMQTVESTVFYGDTRSDPQKFMGLTPRYNDLSGAETSENVVNHADTDAGATNTSIWLVTWDPMTAFAFYGKGTNAGFRATDKGLETTDDGTGTNASYEAWVTHFKWQIGLSVPDWRYVARLCNIGSDKRDTGALTGTALRDDLITLVNKPPSIKGRRSLYMNKKTWTYLAIIASDPTNAGMAIQQMDYFGQMVPSIWGIPIRVADAITDGETAVTDV